MELTPKFWRLVARLRGLVEVAPPAALIGLRGVLKLFMKGAREMEEGLTKFFVNPSEFFRRASGLQSAALALKLTRPSLTSTEKRTRSQLSVCLSESVLAAIMRWKRAKEKSSVGSPQRRLASTSAS